MRTCVLLVYHAFCIGFTPPIRSGPYASRKPPYALRAPTVCDAGRNPIYAPTERKREPLRMTATQETATLGGGCFWCLEAVFKDLRAATWVMSGYAAGHVANPSYEAVCTGTTGHAEVVQVKFDPAELSYADLLRVFFSIHDPSTVNRQGNDVGTQYRSIILTHSDAQAETAKAVMQEITDAKIWS